jgi:heptosyltransferase-1
MTRELKKLLLVKMSALGDVVMTLPALAALKERYPGAALDWLVEPAAAGLLAGHPALNRVLVSPRPELKKLAVAGRLVAAARLFNEFRRELRQTDYDAVLDLQGLFKSGLMVGLARGRRKIGFARSREGSHFFLNEKMPPYDPERHAVRRYLDAAAYLGAVAPEPVRPYFEPPEPARQRAEALLGPAAGSALVILNPGAKWATKRWPLAHWQVLARRLAQEKGFKLVVTGGPEDAAAAAAIAAAAGPGAAGTGATGTGAALNLCGRTNLPELAAIMARTRLMITADTGPLHLAAAVGAGGLALFGPTRPQRTGPWGGDFEILQPARPCLGCLRKKCHLPCLAELTPDMVWDRLAARLAKGRVLS